MNRILHNVQAFCHRLYQKLFLINDSPQKIALGFGLGIFVGIIPGTGPIAALVCAFILRVNRASALIGSLLTNTWLSVVTLAFSIKLGAVIRGMRSEELSAQWKDLLTAFRWEKLVSVPTLKLAGSIMLGYLIISFLLGCLAYFIVLVTISRKKKGQP